MKVDATQLTHWYSQAPGSMLLELERDFIARLLSNIFGNHLLQVGGLSTMRLTAASPIKRRVHLSLSPHHGDIHCDLDELPLQPDSLDVIVVNHALEFCANPRQVLNQLYQALVPSGQLILFGFNPWSLWNICRFFKSRQDFPWNGKFYSISTVRRWLRQMEFNIVACRTLCFRPALSDNKWLKRLLFLDMLGQIVCPKKGAVYVMIAQKRVLGATPLEALWDKKKVAVAPGMVEPVVRNFYVK